MHAPHFANRACPDATRIGATRIGSASGAAAPAAAAAIDPSNVPGSGQEWWQDRGRGTEDWAWLAADIVDGAPEADRIERAPMGPGMVVRMPCPGLPDGTFSAAVVPQRAGAAGFLVDDMGGIASVFPGADIPADAADDPGVAEALAALDPEAEGAFRNGGDIKIVVPLSTDVGPTLNAMANLAAEVARFNNESAAAPAGP